MPPAELAVIVVLAALLAVVSALAGAFWWRSRSVALVRVAQLARELTERQRALEQLIEHWENSRPRDSAAAAGLPGGPRGAAVVAHRIDPPQVSAVTGPTLIAVPDLAAAQAATLAPAPEVAAELQRRYGPIWEMADRGLAVEAIARATGQPAGHIELVLGLRRGLSRG